MDDQGLEETMTFHPGVRPFVEALLEHCQRKSIKMEIVEPVSGIRERPCDHDRFSLELLHAGSVKLEMYVIFNGDNMADFDITFPNDFDFIMWLVRKDYYIIERFDYKEPKSFCKIVDSIRGVWSDYQEHKMNREQRKINDMVQRMFQEINEEYSYQVQGCGDFICYQLEFQFRHKTMLPTQKMYLRVSFKVKVEYATYYSVHVWSSKDLQDLLEEIDYPLRAPTYESKEESLLDFINRVSEVVKRKVKLHYDTMQRSFISLILKQFAERVIFVCFATFRKVQLSMPALDKIGVVAIFTIHFSADKLPPTCEVQAKNNFFGKTFNTELSTVELYENQINYETEDLLEYFCQKMKEAEELVKNWNDGLFE